MLLTLYDQYGNEKAELQANDSSTQDKEVQADNVLSLGFTLYEHVSIDVNDYVDFGGERYWAVEKYEPAEKSSVEWEYSLKLYGIESLMKRFLVLNNTDGENEAVFTLTARPVDHVRLIVKCINDGMGTTDFKVGSVEGTDNVVINYEGKYCDEALKELAAAVGVEWWFDGETVNLSRCEWGSAVVLGYGEGLTSLEQDKADNVKFYTRLFPIGSSRNIDRERYGASRLQLPGGAKYVDLPDLVQKYGVIHHYEQEAFSGIYPRRVGEVSSVRSEEVQDSDGKPFTIYYFKDNGLTFDPNAYEIGGLVKHVSFLEGSELAGLGADNDHYFEVNFNSETREFEIITIWPYDDDRQLPGDTLVPKEGDKYILWNIRMPDEYYTLAETEFLTAVEAYNRKHTQDVSRYKGPTDHVWIEETGTELEIGRRVRLKSPEYFPGRGYRESRITRISRSVNLPSQMDIEISDALSSGTLEKIDDAISDAKSYAGSILGAVNVPDVIKSWEETKPTDYNLYSARKSVREFLSKRKADTAYKKITFKEGAEFGVFTPDVSGAAIWQDQEQDWHIESDFLHARKKLIAKEVQIEEVTHVGGQQLSTAAAMVCAFVVDKGSYWRCFFVKVGTDGRIVTNKWKTGDQAYVKTFNLTDENQTDSCDHYLWRLVVGTSIPTPDDSTYTVDGVTVIANGYAIGETIDASGYHYIDLSKEDCDSGSDAPLPGDNIVQLGYRPNDDSSRRNAVIIAGAGENSPYIYIITGIYTYSLPRPEIQLKPGDNRFTGVVNMQAGSSVDGSTLGGTDLLARFTALGTGIAEALTAATQAQLDAINAQGTADGAQDAADQAQGTADQAVSGLNNLRTGNENLIVNGGFAGSYESESVESTTTINSGTTIFSDPFGHWDVHNGCTIVNAVASATGLACQLSGGLLKQTVSRALTSGTTYTFSLLGIASGSVTVSIGGESTTISLTAGKRSFWTFAASSASAELQVSGSATITELQLIEGNIQLTDWTPSPLDNNRYLSYYKNVAYLLDAIDNASTTVLGGLVLTEMIRVGNYADRVMQQETGGMNGKQVNDNSPFLWGGGNFTQAIETIAQYNANPLFQPTQEQLANMAKFVVTHGGRAILNDIILRGYIFAEGGVFKSVKSPNGNWSLDAQGNMTCQNATIKGNQYTPMFRLTADNYATVITDASTINPQIDLTKTGLNIVVESIPSGARRRVILPQTGEEWNGARFHIVNNCPQAAEIGFLVGPIFYWRQDPDTGEVYKDRDFTVISVYLGGSATFVAVLQENGVDIEWHLLSLTDGLHYIHPE